VIDPQRLVDELLAGGWTVANRGPEHVNLVWPDGWSDYCLTIPLDVTSAVFTDRWEAARAELQMAVEVGVKAAYALAGIYSLK
jgi:hypothetical protein